MDLDRLPWYQPRRRFCGTGRPILPDQRSSASPLKHHMPGDCITSNGPGGLRDNYAAKRQQRTANVLLLARGCAQKQVGILASGRLETWHRALSSSLACLLPTRAHDY
ncbi:hypothetical protein DPEC_G00326920 [Dallia pectoralis]|uniref:Uncharacterized protein n=1 Tax=Dallia pectoralis TaxID=75939 RepID=A0ACC2F800_DALPE|nr:hypothetical protein DPEC_G00326920 [Dallia pectoralis]